ncbi:VOC family protein [Streptomyces sp. NPDC013457]|uniref:VOC family protein n=1 Tax=Streptomyces sp. NPDC013457 TaxID=3364866 RepID=UPI0036F72031
MARDVIGDPCRLSLAARDRQAAERFYGAVLGWTFRNGGFGGVFSVAETGDVPVAGIGTVAAESALPVAWTPYFAADSADAAAERVRERGGTVAVGPVSFPVGGRAAVAADREGAVFGVWDGDVLADGSVASARAPARLELHTGEAFDAALFYGEVLGWGPGGGCCDTAYEEDQVVLRRRGRPVARLCGPVGRAAAKPRLRPRWMVPFRVPDPEEAVAHALAAGGRTVPGHGNSHITLRDPAGCLSALDDAPTPDA